MSWLYLITLIPLLYAILVPLFYKYLPRIHTGWFVLPVPVVLFACLMKQISFVAKGSPLFIQFLGYRL